MKHEESGTRWVRREARPDPVGKLNALDVIPSATGRTGVILLPHCI